MGEQVGARAFFRGLAEEAPRWAERLPQIPTLIYDVLRLTEAGKLNVDMSRDEWKELHRTLRRGQQRLYLGIIAAALIMSAAALLALDGYAPSMFAHAPLISWLMGAVGVIVLIISWPGMPE